MEVFNRDPFKTGSLYQRSKDTLMWFDIKMAEGPDESKLRNGQVKAGLVNPLQNSHLLL